MPFFSVQLDSQVLLWVEELCNYVQELDNEFLLFEQAMKELRVFYEETLHPDLPVSLRRSVTLLNHVLVSMENLIDHLRATSEQVMQSLETSSRNRDAQ